MAIVITLPDDFAIETYSGLKEFLIDHLELDDSTVLQLPSLIRLAEYRLDRMVLGVGREAVTTLATVAAEQGVTLPSDFRQAKQVKIAGDQTTGYPLEQVTQNVVETYDYPGKPVAYAIVGSRLLMGPIPDAAYTLTLTYLQRLAPLTDDRQSNWLLASNADAYVYMACSTIHKHLGDSENAALNFTAASQVIDEINRQATRQRNSAPMRLRSPVVV